MPQLSYSFLLFVSLRLTINKGLFDDDPHKGKSVTVGRHVIDFCRSKDFICLSQISFGFLISNVLFQPIFGNFKSNRECAWFVLDLKHAIHPGFNQICFRSIPKWPQILVDVMFS